MKSYKSKVFRATLIIATAISVSSCTNNSPEGTKETTGEHNDADFDKKSSEKDVQFIVDAAELNRKGILLGQLAQQKGSISEVRALGKMMNDEHAISLDDLTALAKIKNIPLPTSQTTNGEDAYVKLNEKSGMAFGNEFSDMMVDEHIGAIALFEKASIECTDPDIKAWATSTLPVLRKHLEHSIKCQKTCAEW